MDVMMKWKKAWSDAVDPSFLFSLMVRAFDCIKKIFFVATAVMFISFGLWQLSFPDLFNQAVAAIDHIKYLGPVVHFMINAFLENFLMIFVLMACAPRRSKVDFSTFVFKWIAFWVISSIAVNALGFVMPLVVLDVVRVLLEFSFFAWVYDSVAIHRALLVGPQLVIGSLPVVAVAAGMSVMLVSTEAYVLSWANKFLGWSGFLFIITTLYSLIRVAFFITIYHEQKGYYIRVRRGRTRGPRKGPRITKRRMTRVGQEKKTSSRRSSSRGGSRRTSRSKTRKSAPKKDA